MTNGIVIGLSALFGAWLGWYAIPIGVAVLVLARLLEGSHNHRLIITCVVLLSFGAWRSESPPETTSNPDLAISTGAIGRVASFPIPSGEGHRALFEVEEICVADQCIPASSRVLVFFRTQTPALSRGQTMHINWQFQELQNLPTGYRNFVSSQGAEGSAWANNAQLLEEGNPFFQLLATTNQRVADNMKALLPGDTGALGIGIVTGDDSGLSDETEANFRATGTSHITAVSGQNVTLIIGFMSLWFRPKTVHGRLLLHCVLVLAVWNFALFVGLESPVLRAAIVATLSILGNHIGRKPDPVTILSLTLGAIALIQPLSVHSVGFWLSASASMALCLALPKTMAVGKGRFASEVIRAPAVASIATMPIALVTFGVWSPIGILANMLLAPVMTVAFPVTYLFALIAFAAPGLAEYLAWIPSILLDIGLVIVKYTSQVAVQWRIDTTSMILILLLWAPIIVGIWLLSHESPRWIRRALNRV